MSAPDPFRGADRPDPTHLRLAPVHLVAIGLGIGVWVAAIRGVLCFFGIH